MAPCVQTQIAARAARPAAGASEQRTYTTPHRTRVDQDTSIISSPDVLASVALRTRFNAGPTRFPGAPAPFPIGTSTSDGMHARARRRQRQSGQHKAASASAHTKRWQRGPIGADACAERVGCVRIARVTRSCGLAPMCGRGRSVTMLATACPNLQGPTTCRSGLSRHTRALSTSCAAWLSRARVQHGCRPRSLAHAAWLSRALAPPRG